MARFHLNGFVDFEAPEELREMTSEEIAAQRFIAGGPRLPLQLYGAGHPDDGREQVRCGDRADRSILIGLPCPHRSKLICLPCPHRSIALVFDFLCVLCYADRACITAFCHTTRAQQFYEKSTGRGGNDLFPKKSLDKSPGSVIMLLLSEWTQCTCSSAG